jgi:hypothetical protein
VKKRLLQELNPKHRLIKTAKDVKTVIFIMKLVFFNIGNKRFSSFSGSAVRALLSPGFTR